MSKYIDAEKLIAEIKGFRNIAREKIDNEDTYYLGMAQGYDNAIAVIESLQQEQPKFNIGDLVVSRINPHLTYKILATNIPNELGKTDYRVEIFTDGKPGLLDEPHNIHLISSDKIEDWGELVQQEQQEVDLELEKETEEWWQNWVSPPRNEYAVFNKEEFVNMVRHFYELGLSARKPIWHNAAEETPTEYGKEVIVACRNKNKEDGIWLYDLIQCWEGKWEPRVNWETPVKWAYVKDLDNSRKV